MSYIIRLAPFNCPSLWGKSPPPAVSAIILGIFLLPYILFYFLYDLSFVGVMSAAPKYGVGSE